LFAVAIAMRLARISWRGSSSGFFLGWEFQKRRREKEEMRIKEIFGFGYKDGEYSRWGGGGNWGGGNWGGWGHHRRHGWGGGGWGSWGSWGGWGGGGRWGC
jgi:hypothetical protein